MQVQSVPGCLLDFRFDLLKLNFLQTMIFSTWKGYCYNCLHSIVRPIKKPIAYSSALSDNYQEDNVKKNIISLENYYCVLVTYYLCISPLEEYAVPWLLLSKIPYSQYTRGLGCPLARPGHQGELWPALCRHVRHVWPRPRHVSRGLRLGRGSLPPVQHNIQKFQVEDYDGTIGHFLSVVCAVYDC